MAITLSQLQMEFIQSQENQETKIPELSNGRANKLARKTAPFTIGIGLCCHFHRTWYETTLLNLN